MDRETLVGQPATRQLVQVLTELALVSHVRGTSYDPSTSGGRAESAVPTGGLDYRGDREPAFRQKTATHFLKRLENLLRGAHKLSDERAESLRDEILSDAIASLRDWRRTPATPGHDPEKGTRAWKIRVANDDRGSRVVAGHFGISHVQVLRIRHEYAGVEE